MPISKLSVHSIPQLDEEALQLPVTMQAGLDCLISVRQSDHGYLVMSNHFLEKSYMDCSNPIAHVDEYIEEEHRWHG